MVVARDLHQEACDVFAAWTAPSNPAVRQVVHAQLRAEGVTFALGTYRKWRRDLDILADNLDAETAAHLGRLFDRRGPW